MTLITHVDPAEAAQATVRQCKTSELRNAVAALQVGQCIHVPYSTKEDPDAGFKPNTIVQTVGALSRAHETFRFSVRASGDKTGAYVQCHIKDHAAEEARRAARKPRTPKAAKGKATKANAEAPAS